MSTAVTEEWAARARNHRLPLYVRVHAYAEAHATSTGHAPLTAGQLRRGVDATLHRSQISNAIRRAVDLRLLHPTSSARCLVLARATVPDQSCPATHR